MLIKVREILFVSSPYDAFIMEEDGSPASRIINEYSGLNLSMPPRVTRTSSAREALSLLNRKKFDMVITMPNLDDTDAFSLGLEIKKLNPVLPVILLDHSAKGIYPFSRTEFMSVRIDVLDTDPAMAASIANDIASLLDTMKTKIQQSRANSALQIIERTCQEKQHAITVKEDSLAQLRRRGVMDFKNQSTIWNEEYAKAFSTYNNEKAALSILSKYKQADDTMIINTLARIEGAESRMKHFQIQLDQLANFGGASVSLNEELTLERKEFSVLKEQFEKLKMDATQNLSHTFIVNRAEQAEKKAYPTRWLIVLVSTAIAFCLALSIILLRQRIKEIDYKF